MIVKEELIINKRNFVKHYSDSNLMIRKKGTDEIYEEAIDLLPCTYEYEETDEHIWSDDHDQSVTENL